MVNMETKKFMINYWLLGTCHKGYIKIEADDLVMGIVEEALIDCVGDEMVEVKTPNEIDENQSTLTEDKVMHFEKGQIIDFGEGTGCIKEYKIKDIHTTDKIRNGQVTLFLERIGGL